MEIIWKRIDNSNYEISTTGDVGNRTFKRVLRVVESQNLNYVSFSIDSTQ